MGFPFLHGSINLPEHFQKKYSITSATESTNAGLMKEARTEGLAEGRAEGMASGIFSSLKNPVKNMGLPVEQAMSVLEIPEQDRQKYRDLLKQQ